MCVAQNPAACEKLNSTFSCRKTSWTEKIFRSSHTPGAVCSGNVIILCVFSVLLDHVWLHACSQQNSLCPGLLGKSGVLCPWVFPLVRLTLLWHEGWSKGDRIQQGFPLSLGEESSFVGFMSARPRTWHCSVVLSWLCYCCTDMHLNRCYLSVYQ